MGPAQAQDRPPSQGGFKSFLKHTADAVMGKPATAQGVPTGSVQAGTAATTGSVFRPISPAAGGSFEGIFRGYAGSSNVRHYPRVALTFESYGSAEACWRTRATIWRSETQHSEEIFDLCNAPLVMKDDLGHTTIQSDPTVSLLTTIDAHRTLAVNSYVTVTDERTTGPNPARIPFHISVASANSGAFMSQYRTLMARAMVVSGYGSGDLGQLMWVAGFAPGGNRDEAAN